jgi:hypothetical protein
VQRGLSQPTPPGLVPKGQHPAIIDEATFKRCGELLDRHKAHYGPLTGGKPLLTGIFYCGYCGSKMLGHAYTWTRGQFTDRPGEKYTYILYSCYKHKFYRSCDNNTFHSGPHVEEWVKAQVMRLPITEAEREVAREEAVKMVTGRHGDVKAQIKALQDQRDAHVTDLKALSWRLVREEIPAPLYNEMRLEKEAQITALDKQIASIQAVQDQDKNLDAVLDFLKDVDWQDFDAQAWKEALVILMDSIILVAKRQYRIEWKPGVEVLLRPAP